MRKPIFILVLFALMIGQLQALGQFNLLFVNDNAVYAPNTEAVKQAIQQSGFSFSLFDAVDQMRSPTYDEMKNFDLVIWHTSTDGVGLYFWNGTDEDNPHLINYLNEGGNLIVMGNDFLYDRYATPYNFPSGSFVHDYLGTLTYYAQSYGDDGFNGLPQLDLVPGQSIASLNPVQWIFPTLWWADACLPVPSATPVYKMGPPSYPLSSYYSAIFYQGGNFSTLSLFFDPALIDTDANRASLMGSIITYFQNLVGLRETGAERPLLVISPSVSSGSIQILTGNTPGVHTISIFDSKGLLVKTIGNLRSGEHLILNTSEFAPGIYNVVASPSPALGRFVVSR